MLSSTLLLQAMDSLPVAVSVFDPDGTLLYYNHIAAVLLDRKPSYIGQDVRTFLNADQLKNEIDYILKSFKLGRFEPFTYEAQPKDRRISITVTPILDSEERFLGCVESVTPIDDPKEEVQFIEQTTDT